MAGRAKYCTKCGDKRTERPGGICLSCERADKPPERRWAPCTVCGKTTTSKKGTHPACRLTDVPGTPVSLPAGDWRFDPFRRVQIWVPAPAGTPSRIERKRRSKVADIPPEEARKFDCEKCGAEVDGHCVRPDGRPCYGETHLARRRAAVAWHEAQLAPAEIPEPDVRECAYDGCGAWFASDNAKQRYCSTRCKDSAYHLRRRTREQGQEAA